MKPKSLRLPRSSGWRRAALYNTLAVWAFVILIASFLAWSASRIGGVAGNTIIFRGNCDEANRTNLWLHLLLNIVSTCILASSNFFMQVLTSPSRRDINEAHKKGTALDIGVQSMRNLSYLSRRNLLFWLVFFCSSLPIHLVFNSTIFATEFRGSTWNLTLAAEGFINDAPYFPPGALLFPSGGRENRGDSYGEEINITTYFDDSSRISRSIANAAQEGQRWQRMEVPECLSQYMHCSARQTTGDVIWVVRSHDNEFMVEQDNSLGWTRDNLFRDLGREQARFWNPHVPASESNSLWFAAACATTSELNPRTHRAEGCSQLCSNVYGHRNRQFDFKSADEISANFTFDFFHEINIIPSESIGGQPGNVRPTLSDELASVLDLEYCLAQQLDPVCKLGLSNELLLIVLICVIIKALACIGILVTAKGQDPFVVPGDAIASFIADPDDITKGWCTLDRPHYNDKVEIALRGRVVPEPQEWHHRRRRWYSGVRRLVWVRSYGFLACVIILLIILFWSANITTPMGSRGQTFTHSITNGILDTEGAPPEHLLRLVITANSPQLLLSISYFIYNSLYTRVCVEKEWSSYAVAHRALRVTQPEGSQRSTYRLQLPYSYSVPLMIVSALMHWLVSNTLYLFVLEGGYYRVFFDTFLDPDPGPDTNYKSGLSSDAYLAIGYSTVAILAVLIAALVLVAVPLVLYYKHIRSPMPLGGNNSIIISAACHSFPAGTSAPKMAKSKRSRGYESLAEDDPDRLVNVDLGDGEHDFSTQDQIPMENYSETAGMLELQAMEAVNEGDVREGLIRVSMSPIRWGVIQDPRESGDGGSAVGHLGFGTIDMYVSEPVEGALYK
ncbi:hypothetical protein B0I35DRAFT_359414 [Stachybotrys elegans]|uniref:DUF6536 domain-containing protein n=1 Tax=Stachybotrys elegans TaxID=80388 RepID=A0A8K0WMJ4_9HYPO|nr:hypothetical protein B0I35DRAFT_359414 [Stachybotrys elegans]